MKEEEKENMDIIDVLKESRACSPEPTNSYSMATSSSTDNGTANVNGNCATASAVTPTDGTNSANNLDIIVNNVVCNFSVRCHLNLKLIAQTGLNVEYHKEMAMLIMKFRRPRCTASIWSSGKITMTGATTDEEAKKGARRCARVIQKLGFNAKFTNYRVVNVLATCTMPFAIKIADFSSAHRGIASYEPELHPGVTYRMKELSATLKIFSTGSITITASCVQNIQKAVEEIYALVYEFKKERREDDLQQFPLAERKKRRLALRLLKEQQNGIANKFKRPAKKALHKPKKRGRRVSEDIEDGSDISEEEETPITSESEEEQFDFSKTFKTPIEVDEDEEADDDLIIDLS